MKYKINDNAFKEFTKESCYWAGFLAADGCVDAKNRMRVYLAAKDVGHLYKLKNYLKADHKVSESPTYERCSLEVTNKTIVKDLGVNFNIFPNKSYNLQFPDKVPVNLLSHFIRGYWDGDGSICETFSNINSIRTSLYASVVGSEFFILDLVVYYEKLFDKVLPSVREHPNGINCTWKLNTNAAKLLCDHIYKDSEENIRLNRKYNSYINLFVNDNRKTRTLN